MPGVKIDSLVIISSSSSPEGGSKLNDTLSLRRAVALERLIKSRCLPGAIYHIQSAGEDWETLVGLLQNSSLKGKDEAIRIIENTPAYIIRNGKIVGGREKSLMDLHAGRFWWTMDERLFPLLRQATLTVFYTCRCEDISTVDLRVSGVQSPRLQYSSPGLIQLQLQEPPQETVSRPLFAIKTNLLYDAASVINLGIEIPVGKRFSIAADGYFPWWRNRSKDITIQMLAADVEGRYWFGDRSLRKPLTGFFAGAYAGAGYFDFQFGKLTGSKGIQGDFFLTAGINAGYAHRISDHLNLEYSLGIGYFQCNFRKYVSIHDTKYGDIKAMLYPWEVKRSSGVLPTKASISLVWMLSSKQRR